MTDCLNVVSNDISASAAFQRLLLQLGLHSDLLLCGLVLPPFLQSTFACFLRLLCTSLLWPFAVVLCRLVISSILGTCSMQVSPAESLARCASVNLRTLKLRFFH